jgi:hypothetical protein
MGIPSSVSSRNAWPIELGKEEERLSMDSLPVLGALPVITQIRMVDCREVSFVVFLRPT